MADFFKGLAGGMQTGLQFGRAMQERQERERLREAMGLTPQEMQQRQVSPEELARAQAETRGLAAQDAEMFGLGPQEQTAYAPQMPAEGQRVGLPRYQLAGQTFDRAPTQQEIQQARYGAMADVIAERDPARAMQMRQQLEDQAYRAEDRAYQAQRRPLELQSLQGQITGQGQQRELTGLQIDTAKRTATRETGFDSAITQINKTEYKTPAEKNAAVLSAVTQFKGPEAAAQLEANYSTNERNRILTDGAKFDQTIKQARLKGPAAALKAIDDLNDSFKLEIDGFNVTQVNNDGSRVPFLSAKTAEEFALGVDSRIKEGGAFELAKFRQDEQTKTAQIGYYNALAKKAAQEGGSAANQLSGVQVGYARDEKGNPIQVMTALRFNKRSGELESVQVPLERNVVPASALDPEKITKAAEQLVGTPVDPTNKKGPQHTFQTARQAVTDQIFNQYLGNGGPAADLDPKGLAAKILAGQQPAAATPAAPTPVGLSINQQSPSAVVTGRDARFEENARADRAMRDREQRAANDPDLKALRVQLANMRSGDPRKTAELTKELADLRQQRYGF
jgi:hypothetical protein